MQTGNNFYLMLKNRKFHITVVYVIGCTSWDKKILTDLYKFIFYKNRKPITFNIKTGYTIGSPISLSGKSVKIHGKLETYIETYRELLKHYYPKIYSKVSKRLMTIHCDVGGKFSLKTLGEFKPTL
mgnify:CR=1 FL=1